MFDRRKQIGIALALLAAALGVWLYGRSRDTHRLPMRAATTTATATAQLSTKRCTAAAGEVVVVVRDDPADLAMNTSLDGYISDHGGIEWDAPTPELAGELSVRPE